MRPQVRERRGEGCGLTHDEVAFCNALAVNESEIMAMGVDMLKVIASELISHIRKSVTIDWTTQLRFLCRQLEALAVGAF